MRYFYVLILISFITISCSDNSGTTSPNTCNNECDQEGGYCDNGNPYRCIKDQKGCLKKETLDSCNDQQVCRDGVCLDIGCNDECFLGQKICGDQNNIIMVCGNYDQDTCYEWEEQHCEDDFLCVDGECIPAGLSCDDVQLDCGVNSHCDDSSGTPSCVCDDGWVDIGDDILGCQYECTPTGDEVCDDIDNDCDNEVDENLDCGCEPGEIQNCGTDEGVCQQGVQHCIDGEWGECLGAILPTDEICDNLDNNCDGEADNGIDCRCTTGETQECGTDVGVCEKGTQYCNNGEWGECEDSVTPTVETCDGLDNDCDGEPDNNMVIPLSSEQRGVCKNSLKVCDGENGWIDPDFTQIEGYQEIETECDQLDNNCDGTTDSGCQCTTGETQECGTDVGECQKGVQNCVDGEWSDCEGSIEPTDEICDNKDNNCNDQIDENIFRDCYNGPDGTEGIGVCVAGQEQCVAGDWGECVGEVLPSSERCDNLDNNCNNDIDEALTRSCYSGPAGTQNIGLCTGGTQTCSEGDWGDCAGEILPQPEECNNQDDNCDEVVDNFSESCYSGPEGTENIGRCVAGTKTCTDGEWGSCEGEILPIDETCNNRDDDCDEDIDEELTRDCYSGPDGTEDVGLCQGGTETCEAGRWGSCEGEVVPTDETCNNQDDDCDEDIDEELTRDCYTGPEGTEDVGICQGGTETCDAGEWGECFGEIVPAEEICDEQDNNCDNRTDEGFHMEGDVCIIDLPPVAASGYGISLNGTNEYFYRNEAGLKVGDNQDFTIELWVKTDSCAEGEDPAFVSNKDWDSGKNKGWVLAHYFDCNTWRANIGDDNNRADLYGKNINDNKWHHLAVSFDRDGDMVLYQDGEELGRTSIDHVGNAHKNGKKIAFGQDGTLGYPNSFDGNMDEVRIWWDVRTAEEIKNNMYRKLNGDEDNLKVYYSFDYFDGEDIIDESINDFDATLVNLDSSNIIDSLSFSERDLLMNGSYDIFAGYDPQGKDLEYVEITSPQNGTTVFDAVAVTLNYTPNIDFYGEEYIEYELHNETMSDSYRFNFVIQPPLCEEMVANSENSILCLLPAEGGTGGGVHNFNQCPDGYKVREVTLRRGDWLNRFSFTCYKPGEDQYFTTYYGDNSGDQYSFQCDSDDEPNSYAIGEQIWVEYDDSNNKFVRSIGLVCYSPDTDSVYNVGEGVGDLKTAICPSGYRLNGYHVRSGAWTDQIQGICIIDN